MGKQNLKIKEEKDSGFSTIVSGRFTNKMELDFYQYIILPKTIKLPF